MKARDYIKSKMDTVLDGRKATIIRLEDGVVFNRTDNNVMITFTKAETERWLEERVKEVK